MKILVLSGGSGTRLFPLSRENFPKQFLRIFDGESLLQKTVLRALKLVNSLNNIIFLTNKDYIYHIKADIKSLTNIEPEHIIAEPVRRNTAPAITLGLIYLQEKGLVMPDEPILVLPSDHLISPITSFIETVEKAKELAIKNYIVTFGVKPTKPETGYGYIEAELDSPTGGGFRVAKFHEKPSLDEAEKYIKKKNFYWNSGMFCFTPSVFFEELKLCSPDIYELIQGKSFKEVFDEFENMPDISIDYAIMEKTKKAVVVPAEFKWSDVGSFEAIYEVLDRDEKENAGNTEKILIDSWRNLILGEKRLVACVGVEDLIVVETDDVILIAKKGQGQRIKELVSLLKHKDKWRKLTITHRTDYRPWGSFTVLDEGERFKIKRITVKPGEGLSLQMHYHRSEHWVVIRGTALVIVEDEGSNLKEVFVREGESFFIPKTKKHRLINPGKIPLEIIEIQVGEYVEEDDIVRFEDRYKRC